MDRSQMAILQEIINQENTLEMIKMLKNKKDVLEDVQLILFNIETSNFKNFEEKSFGKYGLCSIGDYNKVWVMDSRALDEVELHVGRRVYFDINIMTRIDDYLNGKKVEDESDFIEYLNYIKENNFELEVGNGLLERLSKSYDERLLRRSIESFYKYILCKKFSREIATITYEENEFNQFYEKCLGVGLINRSDILISVC